MAGLGSIVIAGAAAWIAVSVVTHRDNPMQPTYIAPPLAPISTPAPVYKPVPPTFRPLPPVTPQTPSAPRGPIPGTTGYGETII
jgi:hypothetical protein